MTVHTRQRIEQRIVRKFVDDALKAGHRLAVSLERGYDVDDMLIGSTDAAAIMLEAFAGDECHIFVQPATGPLKADGQVVSLGWVFLVFGNDGYDVISDYSLSIEDLLESATTLATSLEN